MNKLILRYFLFLFTIIATSIQAAEKKVYGLHERVGLPDLDIKVHTKLDTGARTSSLGATDIRIFEKEGEQWVRFRPQVKGKKFSPIEKLLVRHSNIKRRVDDIQEGQVLHTVRPVILMEICFDGRLEAIEVNLADRSRFLYPLLLGSATLKQLNVMVDPSLRYQSTTANCK